MNSLCKLNELGQSAWLDFLSRKLVTGGGLRRLIDDDCLSGLTSNPAIFDKAISESDDYDSAIQAAMEKTTDPEEAFHLIAIDDIQRAADEFRKVFADTGGRDGFVSFEVSPRLANDTEKSIERARELWAAIDRPNVFIKIPATDAGLPAIRRLIAEGINVNVTLLFGLPRYREVAEAFIAGLEERLESGHAIERVSSVASFFLSRIDTAVDARVDEIAEQGGDRAEQARRLRGEVAIASAKQAYAIFEDIFEGARFEDLRKRDIRPQRLLWASTSAKDPSYSDVKYVEPLIGAGTVNTMPMETLEAYRDHGDPKLRLTEGMEEARRTLAGLADLGISINEVTRQLVEEGIDKFARPYDRLIEHMGRKLEKVGTR